MHSFGMFSIQPIEDKNLKQLHSMAFGIPRIDDDIYKCIPTPGQLFTNKYGEAPDWVLLPEGEGCAKRIIMPWPENCGYYPPSPRKDIRGRSEDSGKAPDYPFLRGI